MNHLILLLASNSDAEKNLTEARKRLAVAFPENVHFSENHWSAALVQEGQVAPQGECATYLNAVCRAQTSMTLEEVQVFLKTTEAEMGRIRGIQAQGRVSMDMDLVEWNGNILRPKDAAQEYYSVCMKDLLP